MRGELIEMDYRGGGGNVVVPDRHRLVGVMSVDGALLEDPIAFRNEDGSYVTPWAVTERIAVALAPRFAEELVAGAAHEEAKHRQCAIYREYFERLSFSGYSSPDTCGEADRKWAPVQELLR